MPASLQPHAAQAREASQALERALASTRTEWNDVTRQTFDQGSLNALAGAARTAATRLEDLAQQLATVLASLS